MEEATKRTKRGIKWIIGDFVSRLKGLLFRALVGLVAINVAMEQGYHTALIIKAGIYI